MSDKADEIAREIVQKLWEDDSQDDAIVIAAALRAYRDDAWQPIETAPKDGSTILGYWVNGEMHTGSVFHGRRHNEWTPEFDTEKEWDMPTHWQPLPSPPLKSKPESRPAE
jgi:hypothetical protein